MGSFSVISCASSLMYFISLSWSIMQKLWLD